MPRILTAENYPDTPEGHASRLSVEFEAADKHVRKWHEQGDAIWKRFIDERDTGGSKRRVNFYHADTTMKHALLYGKAPKPEVGRRFADPSDDVARVGAEIQERMLLADIEKKSDTTKEAINNALWDYLNPGLGQARVRYEVDFGDEVPAQAPSIDPITGRVLVEGTEAYRPKIREDVCIDYVNWKDFRWSPARTWDEVRLVFFRADMTREQLVERFGNIGKSVPLAHKKRIRGGEDDPDRADPWSRAEVWEVWDKDRAEVFWWVKGFDKVLDRQADPLRVEGFWPCPPPLIANRTTQKLIPTPDFVIAQDLYDGIDEAQERIYLLRKSLRVTGAYNAEADELKNLVKTSTENTLYPVDNWAMFAEKGGIKGQVDWFPLDQVVSTIVQLTAQRNDDIQLVQQVTGMSDVMRGAAIQSQTATESKIKASFGSVRMQAKQDCFADWVTRLQQIKADVIAKHFDNETIKARSNVEFTADAHLADQAIQFIRDRFNCYRIEVKSDQIAMQDRASLTQERTQYLQALSTMFQAAVPLAQALGGQASTPLLLELIKFPLASLRGAGGMESILDQAIYQATQQAQQQQQQQQQQPPDPKIIAAQMKMQGEQMKGQIEMAKIQAASQADLTRIDAETKAEAAKQQTQAYFDVQAEAAKARLKTASQPILGGQQ